MSKAKTLKPPTKSQLLYAARAVFEARIIVEKHLHLPEGNLEWKLRELELGYYRQADQLKRERKIKT